MPNGDAIAKDFQFQIADTVYGTGEGGVWLDGVDQFPAGILDAPDAKTQDVVLNGMDGSYANPDYVGVRVLKIPVVLKGAEATIVSDLFALLGVWVPQTADIDLWFQWPGIGKFGFNGRPRGVVTDLKLQRRGAIRALLRFDCPDPTVQV